MLKVITIIAAVMAFALAGCPTYVDVDPTDRSNLKEPRSEERADGGAAEAADTADVPEALDLPDSSDALQVSQVPNAAAVSVAGVAPHAAEDYLEISAVAVTAGSTDVAEGTDSVNLGRYATGATPAPFDVVDAVPLEVEEDVETPVAPKAAAGDSLPASSLPGAGERAPVEPPLEGTSDGLAAEPANPLRSGPRDDAPALSASLRGRSAARTAKDLVATTSDSAAPVVDEADGTLNQGEAETPATTVDAPDDSTEPITGETSPDDSDPSGPGTTDAETGVIEPSGTETSAARVRRIESPEREVETDAIGPGGFGPAGIETGETEGETETAQIAPVDVDASLFKPDDVETHGIEPDQAEPGQSEPPAVEYVDASHGDANAGNGSRRGARVDAAELKRKRAEAVERNGAIFVDWPKPKVALFFSGEQNGYFEPCGCAGLDNMKGGLKRRHTFIKELQASGWPVVPLDLGGQVKYFGQQAEIKYGRVMDALTTMGYQAIGFGPKDLKLEILGVIINLEPKPRSLVSANVAFFDFESGLSQRYRVVEAGGMRIGVTSVLGNQFQTGLANEVVKIVDTESALAEVVPKLQAARCDALVLLSHAPPEETFALAKRFPIFHFVVTAGGAEEPPARPAAIKGTKSLLIEVGHKGMYVAVVGIYDDPRRPIRYQRVPLDARFPDSPEIQANMIAYQNQLKSLGLEGLGLTPMPHGGGGKFVGSAACADCHTEATAIFENTPHAHATQTLLELDPPRHFDPECLSCHVVGWNPQKYFPYKSGYLSLEETPLLLENGCENCHGPGAAHVAAENGENETEKKRRRKEVTIRLIENEGNKRGQKDGAVVKMCQECHDEDNSPEFDFQDEKYWPEVEHYGKE